ncbi:MAG TPA: FxDxF family PEP-CTERM protein [Methylotenera sp.]
MNKLVRNMLGSAALLASLSANATVDTCGELLSGTYQPATTFASMSYTNIGNVYSFTLSAFDLDAIFTDGSFIGSVAVDSEYQPTISNVVGDTVVSVANGGGPTGIFDFRFDLTGPQQTRLTANETVSWDATFSQPVTLTSDSFALHVQGLTTEQGGSGWYTATPVPEPETYAMMLAGLGMLGFTARRKTKK